MVAIPAEVGRGVRQLAAVRRVQRRPTVLQGRQRGLAGRRPIPLVGDVQRIGLQNQLRVVFDGVRQRGDVFHREPQRRYLGELLVGAGGGRDVRHGPPQGLERHVDFAHAAALAGIGRLSAVLGQRRGLLLGPGRAALGGPSTGVDGLLGDDGPGPGVGGDGRGEGRLRLLLGLLLLQGLLATELRLGPLLERARPQRVLVALADAHEADADVVVGVRRRDHQQSRRG